MCLPLATFIGLTPTPESLR
uniref:Uncharacterized protein n=1 Tax=Anguilla anguilla TaxID=7936 RepID=A0A0E9TX00_ANGAN